MNEEIGDKAIVVSSNLTDKTQTVIQFVKTWLNKQVDAAKFAWTIIIIITGLLGYKAELTPIITDGNSQQQFEQRLSAIEQSLTTDKYVDPRLTGKLKELKESTKEIQDIINSQCGVELNPIPVKKGSYKIPEPYIHE